MMLILHCLISYGKAAAMSRAAFPLTGFVTLFVALAASMRAAFHAARADAASPLTVLVQFEPAGVRTASFELEAQLCFMEFS
jgi:hypothetical protein